MAVAKHPCGCVFDDDFVDVTHHDEGQTHQVKGQKQEEAKQAPTEKEANVEKFIDKVLSRKKAKSDET